MMNSVVWTPRIRQCGRNYFASFWFKRKRIMSKTHQGRTMIFLRGRDDGQFSKKNSYTAKSAEKHRVSAYYYPGPVFYLKKKKKNIIAQAKGEKKYFIPRKLPRAPHPTQHPLCDRVPRRERFMNRDIQSRARQKTSSKLMNVPRELYIAQFIF